MTFKLNRFLRNGDIPYIRCPVFITIIYVTLRNNHRDNGRPYTYNNKMIMKNAEHVTVLRLIMLIILYEYNHFNLNAF